MPSEMSLEGLCILRERIRMVVRVCATVSAMPPSTYGIVNIVDICKDFARHVRKKGAHTALVIIIVSTKESLA